MKRKLIIFTIMTLIILVFKNYQLVLSSTIDGVNIWFYKVLPKMLVAFNNIVEVYEDIDQNKG